eukprot:g8665.t1
MDAPSGTPVSITNSKEQEKYLDLAFRTQAQVDFLRAYCMIGDRRLIANAIEEGIDVNSKTKDGRTAMHLCARIGNAHVLKFLIVKCGGNANARDSGAHLSSYSLFFVCCLAFRRASAIMSFLVGDGDLDGELVSLLLEARLDCGRPRRTVAEDNSFTLSSEAATVFGLTLI